MRFELNNSTEAEKSSLGNLFFYLTSVHNLYTNSNCFTSPSLCYSSLRPAYRSVSQAESIYRRDLLFTGSSQSFLNCWCLPSRGREALLLGPWCFLILVPIIFRGLAGAMWYVNHVLFLCRLSHFIYVLTWPLPKPSITSTSLQSQWVHLGLCNV